MLATPSPKSCSIGNPPPQCTSWLQTSICPSEAEEADILLYNMLTTMVHKGIQICTPLEQLLGSPYMTITSIMMMEDSSIHSNGINELPLGWSRVHSHSWQPELLQCLPTPDIHKNRKLWTLHILYKGNIAQHFYHVFALEKLYQYSNSSY